MISTILCFALSAVVSGNGPASFDSPRLQADCSWLGNSFPGAESWVQQDIRALTVTPDGTVFTNVEWEEGGGNVGEYRDGRLVRYARHTHGWGAMGGEAIAANAKYVYIGMLFPQRRRALAGRKHLATQGEEVVWHLAAPTARHYPSRTVPRRKRRQGRYTCRLFSSRARSAR